MHYPETPSRSVLWKRSSRYKTPQPHRVAGEVESWDVVIGEWGVVSESINRARVEEVIDGLDLQFQSVQDVRWRRSCSLVHRAVVMSSRVTRAKSKQWADIKIHEGIRPGEHCRGQHCQPIAGGAGPASKSHAGHYRRNNPPASRVDHARQSGGGGGGTRVPGKVSSKNGGTHCISCLRRACLRCAWGLSAHGPQKLGAWMKRRVFCDSEREPLVLLLRTDLALHFVCVSQGASSADLV